MRGHTSGGADGEAADVQQLATTQERIAARFVDFGELAEIAQTCAGGGADDERKLAIVHWAAVVFKDLAQLVDRVEVRSEGRGASGAGGAGRPHVNRAANGGFHLIDHLADGLLVELLQSELRADGVGELGELLTLQRNARTGIRAKRERLHRSRDVRRVGGRHRGRVAGLQRGLRGAQGSDGAAGGDAFGATVDQHALGEASGFAGDHVARLIQDFGESGE